MCHLWAGLCGLCYIGAHGWRRGRTVSWVADLVLPAVAGLRIRYRSDSFGSTRNDDARCRATGIVAVAVPGCPNASTSSTCALRGAHTRFRLDNARCGGGCYRYGGGCMPDCISHNDLWATTVGVVRNGRCIAITHMVVALHLFVSYMQHANNCDTINYAYPNGVLSTIAARKAIRRGGGLTTTRLGLATRGGEGATGRRQLAQPALTMLRHGNLHLPTMLAAPVLIRPVVAGLP